MLIHKKRVLLCALFFLSIFISGCETIKGAWQGGNEGAKKDWEVLMRFDGQMQKNMW